MTQGRLAGFGPDPDHPAPSLEVAPLAERMRPRSLAAVEGQEAALGPDSVLGQALARGHLPSLLLWGPPGCGKTSLARLLAETTGAAFVCLSAVLAGVKDVRDTVSRAAAERAGGRRTVLFIDEIHRFHRGQQDALLPHVETGTVTLIGATTENPGFAMSAALLSRCRVVTLIPLDPGAVERILRRALGEDPVLRSAGPRVEDEGLAALAAQCGGDARRALSALEAAAHARPDGPIDRAVLTAALAGPVLPYDREGDEHFDLLSALHKSLRNSDADAAVYWLVRLLRAGADPLAVCRRLIRCASEDIGLADPAALPLAIAARDAVHGLGLPEGGLALVEAAVYLAAAPKSNALALAWTAAQADLEAGPAPPVPLVLRNATTAFTRAAGWGAGYRYAHDEPEGVAALECLPAELAGRRYYTPSAAGREAEIAAALVAWAERRRRAPRS